MRFDRHAILSLKHENIKTIRYLQSIFTFEGLQALVACSEFALSRTPSRQ